MYRQTPIGYQKWEESAVSTKRIRGCYIEFRPWEMVIKSSRQHGNSSALLPFVYAQKCRIASTNASYYHMYVIYFIPMALATVLPICKIEPLGAPLEQRLLNRPIPAPYNAIHGNHQVLRTLDRQLHDSLYRIVNFIYLPFPRSPPFPVLPP